jgi:ankyrin repeat protein
LHYAAHASNPKTIQLFLSKECINAQDNAGATPLHIAASTELNDGDYNEGDYHGSSGDESLAAREVRTHLKSVQLLLDHDADKNIKDKNGKTPCDYASSEKIKELLR